MPYLSVNSLLPYGTARGTAIDKVPRGKISASGGGQDKEKDSSVGIGAGSRMSKRWFPMGSLRGVATVLGEV
jgi:hypothetical protein